MNILAIDYGIKRIGLAKWNSQVKVVLPFGIVSNLDEILQLNKEEIFDKIVVGMPYSSQDQQAKNSNVNRVKEFINQLQNKLKIDIDIFDERFSSQQADRMGGIASRDEKSAMIILEGYLTKNN